MNDVYHIYAPQDETAETEADRAIKDADNNVITETYATNVALADKAELIRVNLTSDLPETGDERMLYLTSDSSMFIWSVNKYIQVSLTKYEYNDVKDNTIKSLSLPCIIAGISSAERFSVLVCIFNARITGMMNMASASAVSIDGMIRLSDGGRNYMSKTVGYFFDNATMEQFATMSDIAGKEDKSNKVTSIDIESTDEQYPSAKAVSHELLKIESRFVITPIIYDIAHDDIVNEDMFEELMNARADGLIRYVSARCDTALLHFVYADSRPSNTYIQYRGYANPFSDGPFYEIFVTLHVDETPTESLTPLDDFVVMSEVSWSHLKSLRDNDQLYPGRLYRIFDYTTTTTQIDTQSAGHRFDVIVRADSTNKLSEEAFAIQHEGDTYFANSNLSTWKLRYCLDNDANRFAWADSTNGKGVIYRMIDEFNNNLPYDFKNILFTKSGSYTNAYTFNRVSSGNTDGSLRKACNGNKIGSRFYNSRFALPFIVINADGTCTNNTFGEGCSEIMCNLTSLQGASDFTSNIVGSGCSNITFGTTMFNITIGNNCRNIKFGTSSTFAQYIQYVTIEDACKYLYVNPSTDANTSFLQYVHIHTGVKGTSSNYKTITVDRGLQYETNVVAIGTVTVEV